MTTDSLQIFRPIPLIRNSERGDFKQCVSKWWWRWNLGLVPKQQRQGALWFGTIWHLLWATVYTPPAGKDGFTRGIVKPSEIHALWDELSKNSYTTVSCASFFGEDDEKEFWDAIALGHVMIDGQLNKWGLDPQYEVLVPEQRFKANIPFNKRQRELPVKRWLELGYPRGAASGGSIVVGVGTFDLPVRDHADGRNRVWILDWKSTNKKVNLKQANKDDQLGMYVGVSTGFLRDKGFLGPKEQVAGGIWSFAKKAMPPDPTKVDEQGRIRNNPQKKHYIAALLGIEVDGLENLTETQNDVAVALNKSSLPKLEVLAKEEGLPRVWGDVSKNQGGPLFWREPVVRNKANRLRQISRIADDAEAIQAVRLNISPVTKNPGDHCNWCPFTDLCDIDEDGGDTELFIKEMFKYEDPYSDHQDGALNSKKLD